MKKRLKAVPAVYVFLERNGHILLMRRYNTRYQDGNYSVPSGHIESAELPTEAIIRETKEEVGVILNPLYLSLIHVSYRPVHDETGNRVDFFFRARGWVGPAVNSEPHKCDDIIWPYVDQLPENMVPLVRHAIKCSRNKVMFSELGIDWIKANSLYKL